MKRNSNFSMYITLSVVYFKIMEICFLSCYVNTYIVSCFPAWPAEPKIFTVWPLKKK